MQATQWLVEHNDVPHGLASEKEVFATILPSMTGIIWSRIPEGVTITSAEGYRLTRAA